MNEQWICSNRSQLWINWFPNPNYLKIGANINIGKFGLNNCTFTITIIGTKLAIPWHMRMTISLLVSITNFFFPIHRLQCRRGKSQPCKILKYVHFNHRVQMDYQENMKHRFHEIDWGDLVLSSSTWPRTIIIDNSISLKYFDNLWPIMALEAKHYCNFVVGL